MKRKTLIGLITGTIVAATAVTIGIQKTKQPVSDTKQSATSEVSIVNKKTSQDEKQTAIKEDKQIVVNPDNSVSSESKKASDKNSAVSSGIQYKNEKLGYSFMLPSSWKDKYVIKEDSLGSHVYYKSTNEENGQGLIFSIINTVSAEVHYSEKIQNVSNFEAKGQVYMVGGPTDIGYDPEKSDYSTYKSMTSDVPSIFKTLITDKTSSVSSGIEYKNQKLGYSFVFPSSWKGKYEIEETSTGTYINFNQANPGNTAEKVTLFAVIQQSASDAGSLDSIPGCKESFVANGIAYKVGGPTDVVYESSKADYSTYKAMVAQIPDVIKTIK